MRTTAMLALLTAGAMAGCGADHMPRSTSTPPTTTADASATPPGGAQPAPPAALDATVAPDVSARLRKFGRFVVDFDESKLTAEHKTVLRALVEASQIVQELFLRQMDPQGPELRALLAADPAKADALRLFDVMGGRWDALAHDEPFIGTTARPPGVAFYPTDMTKEELQQHVAAHPDDKKAFQGYFTVIQRQGGKLTAVPYSKAYAPTIGQVAAKLRQAAAATSSPTLKHFLELRAKAFETDDYFESDLAWMDVKGPVEVTIGPYETYADQVFQYKASFESFVALRDADESAKLDIIAKNLPAIDKNLPLAEEHKKAATKKGGSSPIDVVHLVYAAGQSGPHTVAYNLPNDERVAEAKGTKKVMLKNILQGKFEKIVKPIAARVLAEDQLDLLDAEAMFTYILMHEVAHGVGPGFITLPDGSQGEVSKALLDLYGGIEEAKADITGLVNGQLLIDKGVYPRSLEKALYVSHLATAFRQMRFGVKEAHGKAIASCVRFLMKKGAITHDAKTGRFRVEFAKIKAAVRELCGLLLTIEATGDYAGAKAFFDEYATLSPELERALASIGTDIVVDIAPEFTIADKMKSW